MVFIPKAAPVPTQQKVPEKIQQLETEIAKCSSAMEKQDRLFQEQAKQVIDLGNSVGMLKKAVRSLLVKLGADVPDELIDADQFVPVSAVLAPTTETNAN